VGEEGKFFTCQAYSWNLLQGVRSDLAKVSRFQTDCVGASTEGRDGEMHFVVTPASRQRRLVPVPAAVWRSGFLAGYEPALDATAVALGSPDGEL